MAESVKDASDWLAAARAGSREALGQALEHCRRYLLLVARQHLDPELQGKGGASDLVQETFLEAQRDFACFQGTSEAELLAWLRRLLLNNLSNFSRRYRDTSKRDVAREVVLEADDPSGRRGEILATGPSPSSHVLRQEQAQVLQRALQRLPDDHRRVICLRYQDGL